MDTTYIKMCDCEEIQAHYSYADEQDFVYCPQHKTLWAVGHDGWECIQYNCTSVGIWLPTQSQLQEMVIREFKAIELAEHFGGWLLSAFGWNYREQFTSMEQLWIAFVMKEKHNKVWEGDKWIEKR